MIDAFQLIWIMLYCPWDTFSVAVHFSMLDED
jgi:hypothetical protein